MVEKRGKMIVYKCDICKREDRGLDNLILNRNDHSAFRRWEICYDCIPKLEELIGKGREGVKTSTHRR
jgi:hypothetical protein